MDIEILKHLEINTKILVLIELSLYSKHKTLDSKNLVIDKLM